MARADRFGAGGLCVTWLLGDGATLTMTANLSGASSPAPVPPEGARTIYAVARDGVARAEDLLGSWSVFWSLR